jgi:hypothetical protein
VLPVDAGTFTIHLHVLRPATVVATRSAVRTRCTGTGLQQDIALSVLAASAK